MTRLPSTVAQAAQGINPSARCSSSEGPDAITAVGRSSDGEAVRTAIAVSAILAASFLLGCAENAHLPATAGIGQAPALPPPTESAIPTIAVAPARGWAGTEAPTPASGLRVTAFARDLDHPRWLLVLPDGDVLVAELNAQPSRPKSLRDVVMKLTQGIAGAEVSSPDRILLLRDADGDGIAETRTVFLTGLTSPFGIHR